MKLLPLLILWLCVGCELVALSPGLPKRGDMRLMPDNDLYKHDSIDELSNISEQQFKDLLKEVEEVYKPLVKEQGGELLFVNDWLDSTVNAYATRNGKVWEVHMFGGLARRNEITADAYQLVACHELGHHLGGFPLVHSWAANDGQSDYFAVHACGKKLWRGKFEENAERSKVVFELPKRQCDAAYEGESDRQLCYRLAMASKSLADLLSYGRAKFETPDMSQVSRTNNQHPPGQCRLDTLQAANLCGVEWAEEVIPQGEKESAKQLCVQGREKVGFRPRCWFKPGKSAT